MKKTCSIALALALSASMVIPASAATSTVEPLIVKSDLDYGYMRMAEEGFILTQTDLNGDGTRETPGLLDSNGNEIKVPSGYLIGQERGGSSIVSDGMVIVRRPAKDSSGADSFKYGFMDTKGELIVPAQYDRVDEFSEGLAVVGTATTYQQELAPGIFATVYDYKIGFIDKTGKLVVPMIYEDVSSTTTVWNDAGSGSLTTGFSEGLISVKKDGKWGVIDRQGKIVLAFKYDLPIGSFHNGLASYTTGGKTGFIDPSGKVVIAPAYHYVHDFSDGYAVVATYDRNGNALYGAIDKQGKLVVPIKYPYMQDFHDGMACVSDQSYGAGKYGFVNTAGTLVVPIQYEKAYSFSDGLAMVAVADERFSAPVVQARYGFINTQGKVVIPLKYSYAASFSNGIAAVHLNMPDHIGFIGSEDLVAHFDGKPEYIYLDINGNEVLSHGTEYGEIGFSEKIGVVRQTDGTYAVVKNPCYGGVENPAIAGNFADVSATAYYADPVAWAVKNNITGGTSATTFSPDATCTTAQILTFLWRANGSPEPTIENPFRDVADTDYYAKAARWAHEKELISGHTFAGAAPCTRSMTVTYLWKLAGRPTTGASDFTDVPSGAEYAQAVTWAVGKGITSGTGATTFSPDMTCTRGQIVTFLYRHHLLGALPRG